MTIALVGLVSCLMPLLAKIEDSFDGRHPLVRYVLCVVAPKGSFDWFKSNVRQPFQKRIFDERLGFLPLQGSINRQSHLPICVSNSL